MAGRGAALVAALACMAASEAGLAADASAHRPEFAINAVPAPKHNDPPLMRRAGIGHARFDLNWSLIQGARNGPYDWSSPDREIARLARSKIRALPILLGTPSWIAHQPLVPPTSSRAGRREWRAFAKAAVARYGPRGSFWSAHTNLHYRPVKAWQVWNEPNYPASWIPRPSPHAYLQLLRSSARAIRSVNHHARIVLAGMGPGRAGNGKYTAYGFLARLYRAGAKPYFDAAALHVYAANASGDESQIKRFSATMRHHHDRATPLWITEAGWSSSHDPGHVWAVGSEARQAKLMHGLFRWVVGHARRLNLTSLYWFDWRDIPSPKPSVGAYDFGLRRRDGSAKPAYRVFKGFARR